MLRLTILVRDGIQHDDASKVSTVQLSLRDDKIFLR